MEVTCLIHSLICELSGVFFCNNSDIQWSAGIFFEKHKPSCSHKAFIFEKILTNEARVWHDWKFPFLSFSSPVQGDAVVSISLYQCGVSQEMSWKRLVLSAPAQSLTYIHKHQKASIFLRNHCGFVLCYCHFFSWWDIMVWCCCHNTNKPLKGAPGKDEETSAVCKIIDSEVKTRKELSRFHILLVESFGL